MFLALSHNMKVNLLILTILISTKALAGGEYISYAGVVDIATLRELKVNEWRSEINPFSTDGCSDFMDGPVTEKGYEWLHCCEQHDVSYWSGLGGESAHDQADLELKQCVVDAGYPTYANLIYSAVIAARPFNTYTNVSFRWGYGWPFELDHSPLVQAQIDSVKKMSPSVVDGLLKYRTAKGYPPPTPEQLDATNQVLQKALETPAAPEVFE